MNPVCNTYWSVLFFSCSVRNQTDLSSHPIHQTVASDEGSFEVEFQWDSINFTWPKGATYKTAVTKKLYAPENIVISSIKHYKGNIYVAMPQIRNGVPATLGYFAVENSSKFNPPITPYPSWEKYLRKNCSNLQSVGGMEVDLKGIMWVLDGYRINNRTKCPPKLLLLDLNNKGKTVHSFIFSKEICLNEGGLLNDIVLDDTDGGFAYITDASQIDPGLIVYSRRQSRVWKLRDRSMFAKITPPTFEVHNFRKLVHVSAIALSKIDGEKVVYFCSLGELTLYSINTKHLKNEALIETGSWRREIKVVGKKQEQVTALIVDNLGSLYYSLAPLGGVAKWNVGTPFYLPEAIEAIGWVSSLAFDNSGNLRALTNDIITKFMDTSHQPEASSEVRFRILKLFTNTKSYLHG